MTDPDPWRRGNVGRLLNNAVRRFEERVMEILIESGHDEVPLSLFNLTRNLDRYGTRPADLARRAAMTKQSMAQLVAQAEAAGLVTRQADPTDGRARLVLFTPAGLDWLEAFRRALEQAEAELRLRIGSAAHDRLLQILGQCADDGQAPSDRHPRRCIA